MNYDLKKNRFYQYNKELNWSGAVNFIFVEDSIFLIKRSKSMPTHAGQIAFVGGHKKDGEEHPFETAKREFCEETSLSADLMKDLVLLEPVYTANLALIYPVLSTISMNKQKFLDLIQSNGEWDNAFLASTKYIFNPAHWSQGVMHKDKSYKIFFCPIPKTSMDSKFELSESKAILWGATARIISNFFKKHIVNAKN